METTNNNPSFEDELYGAYKLPDNVPEEIETNVIQYYKHPPGWYYGVIGKINFKFQDIDGKRCEPNKPGAVPVRAILRIFLVKYIGMPDQPMNQTILDNNYVMPDGERQPEKYYVPVILSLKKADQWKAVKLFENFKIPGVEDSEIIKLRKVRYKKFPLYFGMPVKVFVEQGKKGGTYVAEIQLVNAPRADVKKIMELEKQVEDIIEKNRMEREAEQSNVNIPAPDMSVDDILGSDAPDTGEFGDDLPF